MIYRHLAISAALLFLAGGCAQLYRVQLGEIDNRPAARSFPVEVQVSEMGFSAQELADLTRGSGVAVGSAGGGRIRLGGTSPGETRGSNPVSDIADTIALFQIGPRTGKPVYNSGYAERIIQDLMSKCPGGSLTAVMSIREAREAPVVSGEIVRVRAICRVLAESTQPNSQRRSGGLQ
jgi:hypothetical protein